MPFDKFGNWYRAYAANPRNEGQSQTSPSNGLCSVATSSLGSRLWRQLGAAWIPIARDGEAAAVSGHGDHPTFLLLAHSFLGSNQQNDPRQRQRGDDGEKEQKVGWRGDTLTPKPPATRWSQCSTRTAAPSLRAEVTTCWGRLPKKSSNGKENKPANLRTTWTPFSLMPQHGPRACLWGDGEDFLQVASRKWKQK